MVDLTKPKEENNFTTFHCAEGGRLRGELDHDEPGKELIIALHLILRDNSLKDQLVCAAPPDGERESEPRGDSVDHHREVGVEHHEDAPCQRILQGNTSKAGNKYTSLEN